MAQRQALVTSRASRGRDRATARRLPQWRIAHRRRLHGASLIVSKPARLQGRAVCPEVGHRPSGSREASGPSHPRSTRVQTRPPRPGLSARAPPRSHAPARSAAAAPFTNRANRCAARKTRPARARAPLRRGVPRAGPRGDTWPRESRSLPPGRRPSPRWLPR